MAEESEAPTHSGGNSLTKKIGPLPMWGWGVVGIAAVILFLRARASSAANTASQPTAQPGAAGQPGGAGYGPSLSDQLGTLVQDLQEIQSVNQQLGQMQGSAQPIASTPPGPGNVYNYFGAGAQDGGGGGGSSPFPGGPFTPIGQYPGGGSLPGGSGGAMLGGGNYAPVQPNAPQGGGYPGQYPGTPYASLGVVGSGAGGTGNIINRPKA